MSTTATMISITDEAVSQLESFLEDQGTKGYVLRVFVAPGGCSGLQYGLSVEEEVEEGDTVVEMKGVRLLVDGLSARDLGGDEIDSTRTLLRAALAVTPSMPAATRPRLRVAAAEPNRFDTNTRRTARGATMRPFVVRSRVPGTSS